MSEPVKHVQLDFGTATSVWCQGCMTSARVSLPIYTVRDTGVTHISTYSTCPRCNGDNDAD